MSDFLAPSDGLQGTWAVLGAALMSQRYLEQGWEEPCKGGESHTLVGEDLTCVLAFRLRDSDA